MKGGIQLQQPSLDVLIKKVESKYELVVAAAKRARRLTEVDQAEGEGNSLKPVSIALEEIAQGKLHIERPKLKIK